MLHRKSSAQFADVPSTGFDEITRVGTKMASDVVDIAGFLDSVGELSSQQLGEMEGLQSRVNHIMHANTAMQEAIRHVATMAEANSEALQLGIASFLTSRESSEQVANWVRSVETRITAVVQTLKSVESLNREITSIARQVNILAINAKIEAVRAGTHGRGFAVVAEAINELSRNTGMAAESVSEGVTVLAKNFDELSKETTAMQTTAAKVIADTEDTNQKITTVAEQMQETVRTAGTMQADAEVIADAIDTFGPAFEKIAGSAQTTTDGVQETRSRLHALVDDSETVVRLSVLAGGASEDQKFIDHVIQTAKEISAAFEDAIKKRVISEAELFDRTYLPIPATNPQQVMSRFTRFTDAVLPKFQEPALKLDPRVVFSAAVDDRGYLPTHNLKFSFPQGPDVVWNTANSRNRRIFDDRVGLKAGQSREPFLMQVYRRDMGGGEFAMMKDLSAPITVNGRHWGGLRLAYKI
ncbi:methyl-accepting chemotaxis protein [Marivivens donghaensis]|uniref:methyl-accepting chemotaxis protein n=1 Tax=Marivivens donghaensis TaxID=1699413 RepID=UPI00201F4783|nr:methyl-accepting chemotaxis protein [Marivivens donghaensis]MCL7408132.1 methyl-accepting chemotaxis protein [Marivivens donghaensis]MDN3703887.1 methyl-accepting chemotaxis protein [Marivivens donghaensis]